MENHSARTENGMETGEIENKDQVGTVETLQERDAEGLNLDRSAKVEEGK